MAGDGEAASEMGDAQVSIGPCGDTTRDQYARTEIGDTQMKGLSRA